MQNQHGHDLHRIVGFLSNAIADPALIAQYTPEPQYLGFLDRRGHERHYMAWFEAYRARFPDSPITRQLQTQIDAEGVYAEPLLDEYAGGAMTCFFALPPLPANGEPAVEVLSDQGARERG